MEWDDINKGDYLQYWPRKVLPDEKIRSMPEEQRSLLTVMWMPFVVLQKHHLNEGQWLAGGIERFSSGWYCIVRSLCPLGMWVRVRPVLLLHGDAVPSDIYYMPRRLFEKCNAGISFADHDFLRRIRSAGKKDVEDAMARVEAAKAEVPRVMMEVRELEDSVRSFVENHKVQ